MYGQKCGQKLVTPAQNREKQEWTREKPKLDNARKLKGIYIIDPDDRENSEILKNARRKVERPVALAMPCKRMDNQHNCLTKVKAEPKDGKEKSLKKCMVVWWNPTNPRDSEQNLCSQKKFMKTALQGKKLLR